MNKKYYSKGRFYCHKCKQDVDIYPIPSSPNCLRFQIHNDEICRYYKLLNEGSDCYADAEFLNYGGKWKKYEGCDPLSQCAGIMDVMANVFLRLKCPMVNMVNNFDPIKPFTSVMKEKENEKQCFQCMNCRHQSKNFYDFIPYY